MVIYTAAVDGWGRGARLIHAFGLTVTLHAPLSIGAEVILVDRFHPVRLLDLLAESRATVICGVPTMFAAMLSVAEGWERVFGIPLREGYGLTEAGPVCLFNRIDRPSCVGTLGFPFPGVEVTIRDDLGRIVPAGEVGEIASRAPTSSSATLETRGAEPRTSTATRCAPATWGGWSRTAGSRSPGDARRCSTAAASTSTHGRSSGCSRRIRASPRTSSPAASSWR
ncbi:MAG: AMP-binding protein, partial [Gemmatimonadota bacterium]|nr:AMP-binding protein [Gemmatimonadota bacterium]